MKRNISLLFFGLVLFIALVRATPAGQTSALVSCDTVSEPTRGTVIYAGHVKVQFNNPSAMVVRAETMTYDGRARRMTFGGAMEITEMGRLYGEKISLDFGSSDVNLYLLNEAGIVVGGPSLVLLPMPEAKTSSAPDEARKP